MKSTVRLLVIVAGLFIAYQMFGLMQAKYAAKDWPSVPGTIAAVSLNESKQIENKEIDGLRKQHEISTFRLKVRYSYRVNGIEYLGERFAIADKSTESRQEAESWLAKFAAGNSVTVFYNPQAPADSVLLK
ncbi:DUF3592 domain-containing protein [Motiliproteus coralliicola]|uniref:DUF3592 domain-containing protein n=1 Tax=Motiliproteus coralliicola TaxID=2283196 RepID=A0A369W9L7_9GAMM|nr:DUF3592 domain-containing protein [Motiliproteus coralliicola]RDE18003.1 DUF3592 domain-containing protein [Motiliproteus coralliicola]